MISKEKLFHEIGQLLMFGLKSTQLSNEEKAFIKTHRPAGITYFRRNIASAEQLAQLSAEIYAAYQDAPPPFIAIDQEGGRVVRLESPFTVFPPARNLGNCFNLTGSTQLAQAQASALATELKSVGINVDFTPVADTHTNPHNPIIGDRAFSPNPDVCGKIAAAMIRRFQSERLVSCAKHFPGHGDTHQDSHLELPYVDTPRDILLSREIRPFARAILAGVPMIMTAHVVYRNWDPDNMATLSSVILNYLRGPLKFGGLIVSDDLEMKAIAAQMDLGEAAVRALEAGVDLLLVCESLSESEKVMHAIHRALSENRLTAARVAQSLARVRRTKAFYLKHGKPSFQPQDFPRAPWPNHLKLREKIDKFAMH